MGTILTNPKYQTSTFQDRTQAKEKSAGIRESLLFKGAIVALT